MKLVHEVKQEVRSRGETRHVEKSDCHIQRRRGGWTSECDNRREMQISKSLKRDETAQIGWLTGGENFISKTDQ